jgi:hypothetical protein
MAVATLLPAFAQETRSTLFGVTRDPQGGTVPGALVIVKNTDTGTVTRLNTNATGYFEANLLLPGTYEVSAELKGFKKSVRRNINLPVSSRNEVNLDLELGNVTETVAVTSEVPLLETNSVSSGRVLDNRTLTDLPVQGNSALLLVKQTPGVQFGGVNNELGLHSNQGGSDYNVNSNVGQNAWSMDGTPLNANSRRTGYVPLSDTIAEFKVETSSFDASVAQTTGAVISMISKSGTNALHGTGSWQHWQRRWNGSPFFVKQLYYRNIAAAEAAGNAALANSLRSQDLQPSGRSNLYTATMGGPVVIPKLYNGRNKMFFFFSYAKRQDIKTEDANSINRTVPTLAQRNGDFSELLAVDRVRYQLFDPLSVRPDPARPGQFVRDPIPGNVVPRTRILNPAYNAYLKLLPTPNNPGANAENRNNYVAVGTPYNWDYQVYQNRMDYNVNEKHRTFLRWSWNDFMEDRGDWTYESARGLHTKEGRWGRWLDTVLRITALVGEVGAADCRPSRQSRRREGKRLFAGAGRTGMKGELGEPTAGGKQRGGWALLDHCAVLQHVDEVGFLDHGVAVGDDQQSGARRQVGKRLFDFKFGGVVEIGGGLVQHQQPRAVHQNAGDLEPLTLANGEPHAAFADFGVEALRQAVEQAGQARRDGGRGNLFTRGLRTLVTDVFGERAAEDGAVGGHDADGRADGGGVGGRQGLTVEEDLAGRGRPELQQQVGGGGLSGAGGSDESGNLAGLESEVDAAEDVAARHIGEADLAEFDGARGGCHRLALGFERTFVEEADGAVQGGDVVLQTDGNGVE